MVVELFSHASTRRHKSFVLAGEKVVSSFISKFMTAFPWSNVLSASSMVKDRQENENKAGVLLMNCG